MLDVEAIKFGNSSLPYVSPPLSHLRAPYCNIISSMKDMATGKMCDGSRTGRDETWVANRTIRHRRAEFKILYFCC